MTARLLTCPACATPMRVVQRADVQLDRCTGCKGVFLDNGELEKLIALMTAAEQDDDWLQPPAPRPVAAPPTPHYRHDDDYYRDAYKYGHKYKKKSAMKTFMDIFD